MRVVVVGGSGYVGGLVCPILAKHHNILIFDLIPPADGPWEYIRGDVTNPGSITRALKGMDSLIYMAKGSTDSDGSVTSIDAANSAFDVTVKGLYFALDAARKVGIMHAVYTSTMSIYEGVLAERYFHDERVVPDALGVYGFTKNLGEEVCRHAVRAWGMSINALRLCLPVSIERWRACRHDKSHVYTTSDDVAHALMAALNYRHGFEAFMISSDKNQTHMNLSKARRLLNWEPKGSIGDV